MIFRVEKTKNYTVMSNYHLREKEMTLKAKGLLSWMLSNDDEWDYSIQGIVANVKENESAVRSALKELQDFGYLEIKKYMPESIEQEDGSKQPLRGRIEYEYIVHEKPIQEGKIQEVENLPLENLYTENPSQINTKTSNTKKEILSKDNNKNNTSDFLRSATKQSKPNLYDRCISHIKMFTEDKQVQEQLIVFLDSLCEMQKLKGENQFKGILKKLNGCSVKDQLEMISYSIEKGYGTFYPLDKKTRGKTGSAVIDIEGFDSVTVRGSNKEYKAKMKQEIENGSAEKF